MRLLAPISITLLTLALLIGAGFAQAPPNETPTGNIPLNREQPTNRQPADPIYLDGARTVRAGALRFGDTPTNYTLEIEPEAITFGTGSARVIAQAFAGGLSLTGSGHLSFANMRGGFLLSTSTSDPAGQKGSLYYNASENTNVSSRRLPRFHNGTAWRDFGGADTRPTETLVIVPTAGGDIRVSGAEKRTYVGDPFPYGCKGLSVDEAGGSVSTIEEICFFDAVVGDEVIVEAGITDPNKWEFTSWYGGPCENDPEPQPTCRFFLLEGTSMSAVFRTKGGSGPICPGDPSCENYESLFLL